MTLVPRQPVLVRAVPLPEKGAGKQEKGGGVKRQKHKENREEKCCQLSHNRIVQTFDIGEGYFSQALSKFCCIIICCDHQDFSVLHRKLHVVF